MSENYYGLHNQWASRQDDEKFLNLLDLHATAEKQYNASRAKVFANRDLRLVPVAQSEHKGLQIVGPSGAPVDMNHWSFGQIATLGGVPAGLLRDMPNELSADVANWGLHCKRSVEDVGVLLTKDEELPEANQIMLRAATGPAYGRIWDYTVTNKCLKYFGDGVNGDWRVPGIFGKALTEVTKENTTLFRSDRSMYIFLADEVNKIEVPNRRGGQNGQMSRFFYVANSEVGGGTLQFGSGLFDYACSNRIVWGVEQFKGLKIRHTKGAPWRFEEEILPAIEVMKTSAAAPIEQRLIAAQKKKIDDVNAFLLNRFSKGQAEGMARVHVLEEGKPIETLWDAATAVTAYAKSIKWQDERVAVEREGGKILALAA